MTAPRPTHTNRLVSTLARRARTLAGGSDVAATLVGRLRASPLARKAVSRIFDIDVTGSGGTVVLSAGTLLGGQGLDNLPVVLVSLVGADEGDVPQLLEQVAREQVLTAGFRPVILLDTDHFAEVRKYGYPIEYVVPRATWTGEEVWEEYLSRRVALLRRSYQAVGSVDLTSPGAMSAVYLRSFGS